MKPVFSYQHKNIVFETYNSKPEFNGHALCELNQTHSDRIVGLTENMSEADGFALNETELSQSIPAIRTADCLPIWIQSGTQHYLIHAGWRGLASNILKSISHIDFALIGPSIQENNFEVQDDFYQHFSDSRFFHKTSEKLTFDLQGYAKKLIYDISKDTEIIEANICTFNSSELHSYRLNKTSSRNWSILRSIS